MFIFSYGYLLESGASNEHKRFSWTFEKVIIFTEKSILLANINEFDPKTLKIAKNCGVYEILSDIGLNLSAAVSTERQIYKLTNKSAVIRYLLKM